MRFLNKPPNYDLTYSDVFFVPGYSEVESRFEVDIASPDIVGASTPIVVANMNAVAGKRMAETIARRGGLAVLPQDIPFEVLQQMIKYIKSRHTVYETALTLSPESTVAEALNIIHKRSHDTVVIVDAKNQPQGIFKERDAVGYDRFTPLAQVMSTELVTVLAGWDPEKMFDYLNKKLVDAAPVVEKGRLAGLITKKVRLPKNLLKPGQILLK